MTNRFNRPLAILLTWLILGNFNFLKAQSISRAKFEEGVDYINCQIVGLSLRDQPDAPSAARYQQQFPNCQMDELNGAFYDNLKLFLNGLSPTPKLTLDLALHINSYKQRFDAQLNDQQLYKILTEDLFQSQQLQSFGSKPKRSETFPALRTEINNTLAANWNLGDPDAVTDNVGTLMPADDTSNYMNSGENVSSELEYATDEQPENSPVQGTPKEPSFFETNGNRMVIFLLVGVVAYFVYRQWNRLKRFKRPKMAMASKEVAAANAEIAALKQEIERLKVGSAVLQEELEMLRHKLAKLEKLKADSLFEFEEAQAVEEEEVVPIALADANEPVADALVVPPTETAAPLKQEVFFMPIPSSSGVFKFADATPQFHRTVSVYRFETDAQNPLVARFHVHEDIATMIRSLDNFDEYLKPACRPSSILHVSATRIITDEKGVALKEGDMWRVVQKAVIHYS